MHVISLNFVGFMVPVLPESNKFVTDNNFSTAFENHDQQTSKYKKKC